MGPPEFFRTIKSVEYNCNERKKTDKDLRYMVKLGTDNIELWTKHLWEKQYTQQPLATFGEIEEPNIQRIIITPNFGQSPPKGHGKPHNYSTLQQQTPQGIEQEKTSEAEPTQNIPQGEIEVETNYNILQTITGEIETEETPNHNPTMQEEAENETPLNPNALQGIITPNTDIFQAIMRDIQNDISINQSILEEQTQREMATDQNPSQNTNQQQGTLKRNMDNNEREEISPKRPNMKDTLTDDEMIIEDIMQSPSWQEKDTITETSQIEEHNINLENHLEKMKEMIYQATTPITPIRIRTRSQEKEEQLNNLTENRNNQGKTHIKGIQRINKSGNRGRNQKPNPDNKTKETDKEQKQDNSNKIDNEHKIATSTPT